MTEPFFSRWSKRKQAVAKGLPAEEAVPLDARPLTPPTPANAVAEPTASSAESRPAEPLPTLDDLKDLTPSSDFQPFMRPGVAADVRNAAVKKLFTDPHFNVMDGLDIYIGDYNTPDPMPAGMLQKMVGAQMLGLWDKPANEATQPGAQALPVSAAASPSPGTTAGLGENPEQSPAAQEGSPVVAQSPPGLSPSAVAASPELQLLQTEHPQHDHPDLQLQPNHAPASPSPGSSTG